MINNKNVFMFSIRIFKYFFNIDTVQLTLWNLEYHYFRAEIFGLFHAEILREN